MIEPKEETQAQSSKERSARVSEKSKAPKRPQGAQRHNRNAAKVGEDLRLELYLSKVRRKFFEEWFEMTTGRKVRDEEELREAVRRLANVAIDRAILEEFERRQPSRVWGSSGETF